MSDDMLQQRSTLFHESTSLLQEPRLKLGTREESQIPNLRDNDQAFCSVDVKYDRTDVHYP